MMTVFKKLENFHASSTRIGAPSIMNVVTYGPSLGYLYSPSSLAIEGHSLVSLV